jgi:hypothetical protein
MQRNRIKRKLIDCAHFVPEDVASGGLSDSADFRISKLPIPNTGLGSTPSRHQQNKELKLNWPLKIGEAKIVLVAVLMAVAFDSALRQREMPGGRPA